MFNKRKLLAAGLVKDYRFRDHAALEEYIRELEEKKIRYEILEKTNGTEGTVYQGTVLLRISVGYNQTPLIQLYD